MPRPEAEVLAGGIPLLPADIEADRNRLTELAQLCLELFTPSVALEEGECPECIFLNVQGCTHLFRGERGLVREVLGCFRSEHWRIRVGLADSISVAWAVAHFARDRVPIVPVGQGEAALRPLPLAALRLPDDAIATLQELGIRRIGQLLALPRADLKSRFDAIVPQRLRQALGLEPELLTPVRLPEPIRAHWETEDPISCHAAMEQVCGDLLDAVLAQCHERGAGLLQCVCRFSGESHTATYRVDLVRSSKDRRHVLSLLTLQWEQRPFPAGVQSIQLEVTHARRNDRPSGRLFDAGHVAEMREIERWVERLSSRLGKDHVLQPSLVPDAQPEFAVAWHPWLDHMQTVQSRQKTLPEVRPPMAWDRPLSVLARSPLKVWSVVPDGPPQRVEWQGALRGVLRWWGPERIETGWWNREQSHRDYYRIELETGEWLWIFREDDRWQLHGVFD